MTPSAYVVTFVQSSRRHLSAVSPISRQKLRTDSTDWTWSYCALPYKAERYLTKLLKGLLHHCQRYHRAAREVQKKDVYCFQSRSLVEPLANSSGTLGFHRTPTEKPWYRGFPHNDRNYYLPKSWPFLLNHHEWHKMVGCSVHKKLKRMGATHLTAKVDYLQHLIFSLLVINFMGNKKTHNYINNLMYEVKIGPEHSNTIAFVLLMFLFFYVDFAIKCLAI
jgi:hypothetical protein